MMHREDFWGDDDINLLHELMVQAVDDLKLARTADHMLILSYRATLIEDTFQRAKGGRARGLTELEKEITRRKLWDLTLKLIGVESPP